MHVHKQLIGMSAIYPTDDPELVALFSLGIHPRYQGQGHGRQLLLRIFDWCLEHKKTKLYLSILENEQADRLTRFYTTTFLPGQGNLVYQGTLRSGISCFLWQQYHYIEPKVSQHKRFLHKYLEQYLTPSQWVKFPAGAIGWK